jgi:hypothetical protein
MAAKDKVLSESEAKERDRRIAEILIRVKRRLNKK